MPTGEPTRLVRTSEVPITAWDFGAQGDEPVVLAVHDFTANGRWFGDLAGAGVGRFRLVAPDLRGRAASTAAPPPAAIDDHVADLIALADRLGTATCSIVGHGTGAMLALSAAAAAPTRLTRVVLLDGPPVPAASPQVDWIAAAALVDPGVTRLRRTWAHRDSAIADGVAAGRLPASGMSRSLRRAVDAEVIGSGFGWRARLAATTLERDWALLQAWSPPPGLASSVTSVQATHGHRVDDPPLDRWPTGATTQRSDTTHTGILVDPDSVRFVAAVIDTPIDTF